MDAGHQLAYTYPLGDNHASASDTFPYYFVAQATPSASVQSAEDGLRPPNLPFDPHLAAFNNFSSTPLVDYAIFDNPVDISLGTLPPRPTSSRALAQGRIPRPRNAFMLFRSAFHREKRLAKSVEKDHRHISRIIGLCWAELPEAEKDRWRQKAEIEKQQHALAYPEYRFKPTPRAKQPIKRNVKRNSPKEIDRCHKIAKLLRDGKSGDELAHAVRRMEDDQRESTAPSGQEERGDGRLKRFGHVHPPISQYIPVPYFTSGRALGHYMASDEPPPFRSPLLPPSELCQVQSKRPESAALPESALKPSAHHSPETSYGFCTPQVYTPRGYMHHGLDQSSKLPERLQADGSQSTFGWSTRDLPAASLDQASLKQQYTESSHNFHYAALGARSSLHTPYPPGVQYIPNIPMGEWGAYYRQESARVFTEPVVSITTGVYGSLSTSTANASGSPVRSNSPAAAP